MNPDASIAERISAVREQIATACERFDRDPARVNLLAVSKTKPAEMIRAAMMEGQRHFGENYLQEAESKIAALCGDPIVRDPILRDPIWHYIGAIQSNKTRPIAENFDWVHTLASSKHGRRLNDQRPADREPVKVLIQVNIGGESSKAGVAPGEAGPLIEQCLDFERLDVRGLMAIPPAETDIERQRHHCRALARLRDDLEQHLGKELPDLSMGMSGDLEAAIAEGSTWLRIGTAIFGAREKQETTK